MYTYVYAYIYIYYVRLWWQDVPPRGPMGRWLSSAKRALLKVTLAPPKSTLEQRSAKRLLQNPLVSKTKEWPRTSFQSPNLLTHLLTHRH